MKAKGNNKPINIPAKMIIADFGATCLPLKALSIILALGAVTANAIWVSSLF